MSKSFEELHDEYLDTPYDDDDVAVDKEIETMTEELETELDGYFFDLRHTMQRRYTLLTDSEIDRIIKETIDEVI